MSKELEELKSRVAALELELAKLRAGKSDGWLEALGRSAPGWMARRCVRRRSEIYIGP
jgi:hypothetical protein